MSVDPIFFFINSYAAFVYAIIYLSISAFPFDFEGERGWNSVVGSLPFLAILVGVEFGGAILLLSQKFYVKRLRANNNKAVPEARLLPMMIGSFFFAGGLFIIGWTSDKSIPWIGALAANLLLRSLLAGAFTLFAYAMFTNMGIEWACSLLGFIAVAMIPIPFLFFFFGKRIRAMGKRSTKSL